MVLAVVAGAAGPASAGSVARTPPAKWDPRVRDLVRFVERERRLEFDHPIPVEFLDDAAFVDALAVEETAEDLELDRFYADDLYALGLVGPDFDLTTAVEVLDAAGVSGFYDDETKEMKVRGRDLDDVIVRATVVHELTHALQDQTFDFAAMRTRAKTSGADFAATALIEGDATWIEEAYVATLPRGQQDEYYAQYELAAEPDAAASSAPAVDLLLSMPYTLGYSFVDYVRARGGSSGVDEAFEHAPPSDEQVVDPVAFVGDERPVPPPRPKLEEGEERRGGADEIGVVQLFVVLAARLDPRVALEAATGWKGDTYVGYSKGEVPCIRAAISTDGARDARQLVAALKTWAGADAVSIERRQAAVHLDACGVAGALPPTEEVLLDASDVLSARYLVYKGVEMTSTTLRPRDVRCVVDLQITDPEVRDLLFAPEITAEEQRRFDRRSDQHAARCGLVSPG